MWAETLKTLTSPCTTKGESHMYESPSRQRGLTRAAGAHDRQEPTEAHTGSRRAFLRRHVREADAAARQGGKARQHLVSQLLHRTADTRNLKCAFDALLQKGPQS